MAAILSPLNMLTHSYFFLADHAAIWFPSLKAWVWNHFIPHESLSTGQYRYNAVDFLENFHNRCPIARPWCWDMGCLLWVRTHDNGTRLYLSRYMMTSSNGNIFCVTGPLCGEFTGHGEFPAQRPVTRSFVIFFDLRPNLRLSKQSGGDLRRNHAHYDVIVM